MDRSGTYKSVVIKAVPHAAIVCDKFHIVANYNKAIDKVRRSEWHKTDEEHKSFIKGQRYNLFRNPENRKPEQTADLNTLLLLNESLFKAYILKSPRLQVIPNLVFYVIPYMIHGRLLRLPELFYLKIKQAMLCLDISNEVKNLCG